MRETSALARIACQPQVSAVVAPRDENEDTQPIRNDDTQPIRIISSRETRPAVPRPRVSWFKKYEESGVRRTPDFTEIGDPPA